MNLLAYKLDELKRFNKLKLGKKLQNSGIISKDQLHEIELKHSPNWYSPGLILSIVLALGTFIGSLGVFGLFILGMAQGGEEGISIMGFICFIISFASLEFYFVSDKKHFRSGVSEALIVQGIFSLFGAIFIIEEPHEIAGFFIVAALFLFCAIRYNSILSLLIGLGSSTALVVAILNTLGGFWSSLIPFISLAIWIGGYSLSLRIEKNHSLWPWHELSQWLKGYSMVLIYLSVNYYVVRELSAEMLGFRVPQGEDIPLAMIFYTLTILIPIVYLYIAINKRDYLFLRIGLVAAIFSAITFKIYYSTGHPEISLTLGGLVLMALGYSVMKYLKEPKKGITIEPLYANDWLESEIEAFVVGQTLGGNEPVEPSETPIEFGDGDFGGGGAGGSF